MTLEHLWAGWRDEYVSGASGDKTRECVLCRLANSSDEEARIVHRAEQKFVVMKAYPYTSGHVMVVPNRHVGELELLSADEMAELWTLTTDAVKAIKAAFSPGGINVGVNLGRAAGAGFVDHLHVHVVPRWNGDTNFMTTLADTRVLPEALITSAEKLRASWPN